MEEVSLTETEQRYFSDLFLCCDVEKTGKIPMLKAMELYRSANLSNEVIFEITSLAGIPATALHISRAQFYSCLKLIGAFQASMPLRQELIAATVQLPLPRFSWKDSPSGAGDGVESLNTSFAAAMHLNQSSSSSNGGLGCGLNALPPPPLTDRKNSLPQQRRGSDWLAEMAAHASVASRRNSAAAYQQQHEQQAAVNSDVPSTDSEVEPNESSGGGAVGGGSGSSCRHQHRRRANAGGSPEAWSTNSESPTPTNSVAERPWAKENLWHGLLGDEHRQLLGTEEESSDRHSSEEEPDTVDLETLYQTTPEQREYYYTQFRKRQLDPNGLLSGKEARDFFEKSRIPVEELRHIWQLCDVTRDGALSLAEFTAAMHLVVLRRYQIPLPTMLPMCLHPNILHHQISQMLNDPPQGDLLNLDEDDEPDNRVIGPAHSKVSTHMAMAAAAAARAVANEKLLKMACVPASRLLPPVSPIVSTLILDPTPPIITPPNVSKSTARQIKALWTTGSAEVPSTNWTKFTESPTSNLSSPGPKPVNFDMQRTAQAVVSDPQILHPVPLRVTPVAGGVGTVTSVASASVAAVAADVLISDAYESGISLRDASPKQAPSTPATATTTHNRDSLLQSNDLRAIQRPQPKKLLLSTKKNIGALPPPPQRESSIGSVGSETPASLQPPFHGTASGGGGSSGNSSKKDPPPLPPPRPPHRHARSSSLDLNKFKLGSASGAQQPEIMAQTSFDLQTSTGFADFTNFPDGSATNVYEQIPEQQQQQQQQQQHSLPAPAVMALPPTRFSLQSNQRVSAFEVYRKPQTPRNSQSPAVAATSSSSAAVATTQQTATTAAATAAAPNHAYAQPTQPPPPAPFGAAASAAAISAAHAHHLPIYYHSHHCAVQAPPQLPAALPNVELYERRVNAISETLRHVSFRKHQTDTTSAATSQHHVADVLRHLREQNQLLLRLCNDLSDELLTVQTRRQELSQKLETMRFLAAPPSVNTVEMAVHPPMRTASSISAPVVVTANTTGGSSGSSGGGGIQSNV